MKKETIMELIAALLEDDKEPAKTKSAKENPVLVWTAHRGVIFGYTDDVGARPITLRDARMCLYWSKEIGGVFGLAEIGPNENCKISARLRLATFEDVTGVAKVTSAAEGAWNNAPVQGRDK